MNSVLTIDQLAACFQALGLCFEVDPAADLVVLPWHTDQGNYLLLWHVDSRAHILRIQAGRLLMVPSERQEAEAQAVAQMNLGLRCGAFYLDLRDGELGFQLTMPCYEVPLTPALVGQTLVLIGTMLDGALPVFQRLRWTDETAAAALTAAGLLPALRPRLAEPPPLPNLPLAA